jgi:hypothetical protein
LNFHKDLKLFELFKGFVIKTISNSPLFLEDLQTPHLNTIFYFLIKPMQVMLADK